jgi:hypothetical protein
VKRITAIIPAAVLLSGCAAATPPAPPAADPPAGVSVSLAQWRLDEARHTIEVAVRNTGTTPVYFSDVQLVTPSFKTLPAEKSDALIRHTDRTDLRIPYGTANCSPTSLPTLRPATVVAHLRTGSEALRRVVFKVPHPDPLLTTLLRDECSSFLITEAAGISFGTDWKIDGKVMRGSIVLTRKGAGTVTVREMDGTTHYNVTPARAHPPLVTLEAGRQQAEAAVSLTPAGCSAHVFAEAKKAFLFPVRANVDGGQERVVIVVPPKPLQDRLLSYALHTCGLDR